MCPLVLLVNRYPIDSIPRWTCLHFNVFKMEIHLTINDMLHFDCFFAVLLLAICKPMVHIIINGIFVGRKCSVY